MANIAKRPDGRWRARYRDSASKEHSRHFKRKIDAQRRLDDVTTAVTSGMYVDPGRSRITVREWSGRRLETSVDLKPSTTARYSRLAGNPADHVPLPRAIKN